MTLIISSPESLFTKGVQVEIQVVQGLILGEGGRFENLHLAVPVRLI
jgi:hypothetical protein